MGKILASENKDWWSRLNTEYTRFVGASVTSKAVSEGNKITSVQMNDFLNALGELKNKNYSKLIDWSNYNSLSIQPGDLINIIAVDGINTTLERLSNQCVYDSKTSYSTGDGYTTNNTYNQEKTNWAQDTSYSRSPYATESNAPEGHSNTRDTYYSRQTVCANNTKKK